MKKALCMLLTVLIALSCACAHAAEEWICESCRQTNAGNFCSHCGAKKPEASSAQTCPSCAFELAPGLEAKFCPNCGHALSAAPITGQKYVLTGTVEAMGEECPFLEAVCLMPNSGDGILMTVDALKDGDDLTRVAGLYLTPEEILMRTDAPDWVRLVDPSGSPISVVSIADALESAQRANEAAMLKLQRVWAAFLKRAEEKADELKLEEALSYNPSDNTFVFTLDSKQVKAYLDALIDDVTQDVQIAALLEDAELLSALGLDSLAGWQDALSALKPEYAFLAEEPIRLTVSGGESVRVALEQLSTGDAYHADAFFYSDWRGFTHQGTLNVYEVEDGVATPLFGGNFTLTNEYSDPRTMLRDTYRLNLSLAADDGILAGNFRLMNGRDACILSADLTDSGKPLFDGELTLAGDANAITATLRLGERTQAMYGWNETYTLSCGEDDAGGLFLRFQTGDPGQELRVNASLEETTSDSRLTVSWSDAASPSNDGAVAFHLEELKMEPGDWQAPQAASDFTLNPAMP